MTDSFTRRDILQLAGAVTAGAVFPHVAGAAGISGRPIRLGVIGTGNRGQYLSRVLLRHGGVDFPAVCDIVPDKAKHTAGFLSKHQSKPTEVYTKGPKDYLRMLERDDLDAVLVASPMQLHAPMSVAAMKAGKGVLSEVGAACTLDECWDLVRTVEQTRQTFMMAENCCYYRDVMAILNMVQAGLFGKLTYAECGYIHNCRWLSFNKDGSLTWRGKLHTDFRGNLYPTHAIGPVAQWMGITRTDQFKTLTAMSNGPLCHDLYAEQKYGQDSPGAKAEWITGDRTNSLIQCAGGAMIDLRYDTSSPRPHPTTTHYRLQGTKGAYVYEDRHIYVEGKTKGNKWDAIDPYLAKYEHDLWKKWGKQASGAGHGGADYFTTRMFLETLRTGGWPPIDVYDAAVWSSIMPLSGASVEANGAPQAFPDFLKNSIRPKG